MAEKRSQALRTLKVLFIEIAVIDQVGKASPEEGGWSLFQGSFIKMFSVSSVSKRSLAFIRILQYPPLS